MAAFYLKFILQCDGPDKDENFFYKVEDERVAARLCEAFAEQYKGEHGVFARRLYDEGSESCFKPIAEDEYLTFGYDPASAVAVPTRLDVEHIMAHLAATWPLHARRPRDLPGDDSVDSDCDANYYFCHDAAEWGSLIRKELGIGDRSEGMGPEPVPAESLGSCPEEPGAAGQEAPAGQTPSAGESCVPVGLSFPSVQQARRDGPERQVSMDGNACPQWLAGFAWEVNSAVRRHNAVPVFREMLEAWMADMEAQGVRLADEEKRYSRYVTKVRETPKLRDSRAFHTNSVNGETDDGLKWFPLPVFGQDLWCWAPPEFRIRPETRPTDAFPLPLPADRGLARSERYAALAAVHDLCCNGQEKVGTWPKPGECTEREDKDRYYLYQSLLERVEALQEADLPALTALLDETRREIESDQSPAQVAETSGMSRLNEQERDTEHFFQRASDEIHEFFFPPAPVSNMALFRERITYAIERQRDREEEAEKATAAERCQIIRENPRLQDKAAGPPDEKSKWAWVKLTDPDTGDVVEGWLHDCLKPVQPLSILDADTPEERLPCRYLEIAMIHDWTDDCFQSKRARSKLLEGFDRPKEIAGDNESFIHSIKGSYRPGVLGTSEERRHEIDRALADVKADLHARHAVAVSQGGNVAAVAAVIQRLSIPATVRRENPGTALTQVGQFATGVVTACMAMSTDMLNRLLAEAGELRAGFLWLRYPPEPLRPPDRKLWATIRLHRQQAIEQARTTPMIFGAGPCKEFPESLKPASEVSDEELYRRLDRRYTLDYRKAVLAIREAEANIRKRLDTLFSSIKGELILWTDRLVPWNCDKPLKTYQNAIEYGRPSRIGELDWAIRDLDIIRAKLTRRLAELAVPPLVQQSPIVQSPPAIEPDRKEPPKEHTMEQPWRDDAPEYLHLKEARKLIDDRFSLSALSKLMTPDGEIRYMRKPGFGCKVHLVDFRRHMRGHQNDPEWAKAYLDFRQAVGKGDRRWFWHCGACGHDYPENATAPERCPICKGVVEFTAKAAPKPRH